MLYLFQAGYLSPTLQLMNENQRLSSAVNNADKDNNELRAKISNLKTELKSTTLKIDQLNDKLELKQLKAQFKIEQSRMITQLIASCISSTSSGEDYRTVSSSESGIGWGESAAGGAAAAVAITSIEKPQNGAAVFSECLKVYNTELKSNFLHLAEQ